MRLVEHLREVSGRLVRVHAEEERRLHAGVCSEARRMVPPSSGCPVPRLIGSASNTGTGSFSRRYRNARFARYRRSKAATACAGL